MIEFNKKLKRHFIELINIIRADRLIFQKKSIVLKKIRYFLRNGRNFLVRYPVFKIFAILAKKDSSFFENMPCILS